MHTQLFGNSYYSYSYSCPIDLCDSCLMNEPQSADSSVAPAAAEPDVVSELDGLPNLPGFAPVSDATFT